MRQPCTQLSPNENASTQISEGKACEMSAVGIQASLSSYSSWSYQVLLDVVDTTHFAHQDVLCGTTATKIVGTEYKRSLMLLCIKCSVNN